MEAAAAVHCALSVTDRLCLRMNYTFESACKSIPASEIDWLEEVALVVATHIVDAVGSREIQVEMRTKRRS
jgi:hypothetical protein